MERFGPNETFQTFLVCLSRIFAVFQIFPFFFFLLFTKMCECYIRSVPDISPSVIIAILGNMFPEKKDEEEKEPPIRTALNRMVDL